MRLKSLKCLNGEGGIRTHGTFRYTRFQVERIRPLCHLSKELRSTGFSFYLEMGNTLRVFQVISHVVIPA